jgi:hypothetical protein
MKSLILYGSAFKLTNAHREVGGMNNQPSYYVRVKVFNGDVDAAMDAATPELNEVVLNTVPYPDSVLKRCEDCAHFDQPIPDDAVNPERRDCVGGAL